jgi:hypothetical protein
MPSAHPKYRQLVLFDGTDNRAKVLQNIKGLSNIPNNCDFRIFCNESNATVEASLKNLTIASHVSVHKSSDPISQISDTLQENIRNYSFILIIYDEQTNGKLKWNKNKEVQMNTCVMLMDPSDVTVECILCELYRHEREENAKGVISIESQVFSTHQCPRCSQSFRLNNDLQQHCKNNHFSITDDDVYLEYSAKILYNKRSNRDDRYKPELYCAPCDQGFQTLEARCNHVKEMHTAVSAKS